MENKKLPDSFAEFLHNEMTERRNRRRELLSTGSGNKKEVRKNDTKGDVKMTKTNENHYDYGEPLSYKISDGFNKWMTDSKERQKARVRRIEEELQKPPVTKEQLAMERALERYFGKPASIHHEDGNIPDKYRGENNYSLYMIPERKQEEPDPEDIHPMDKMFRDGYKAYKESLSKKDQE